MSEEEMRARIVELEEANKNLTSELESLKTSNDEKDKKIVSLQEHNQKLFLKVTTPIEKTPVEKTDEELVNDVCESILKVKKI